MLPFVHSPDVKKAVIVSMENGSVMDLTIVVTVQTRIIVDLSVLMRSSDVMMDTVFIRTGSVMVLLIVKITQMKEVRRTTDIIISSSY